MRRREFIAGFGAAAALSKAGRAQQSAASVVGYLDPAGREVRRDDLAAVVKGLKEEGFVEGRNLELDVRFAQYDPSEMPKMAYDLVRRRVAVIFARTPQAAHAAKAATATIPIVFMMGEDPVAEGLVASFSRPGGNLTGFTDLANQLGGKQLELLHEAVPKAASVALLVNPNNPNAEPDAADMRAAAAAGRLDLHIFKAIHEAEFEPAFAAMVGAGVGALAINTDPYFGERRALLVALAARYSLPTLYPNRVYSLSGGLISYSPDRVDTNRQAGIYVGRILKGEKPADLPVQQSTKFDLVINMQAARALNLSIPETLLATADQVIE